MAFLKFAMACCVAAAICALAEAQTPPQPTPTDECPKQKDCASCVSLKCTWTVDEGKKQACVLKVMNLNEIASQLTKAEECPWLDTCMKIKDCKSCTGTTYKSNSTCLFDTSVTLCSFSITHSKDMQKVVTNPVDCEAITTTPAPTTTSTTSTSTTTSTTSTTPSTTSTSTTTTTPTPSTTTTTAAPSTTASPPVVPGRKFDAPSFIGGIVLALGCMAISFVAWKFYKARTERNYHTL
ncbi:sialomucin core protein 24-like [Neocloeon triangulifer]|uniref:sialomucin core protein 24-like n=1 Tax=Neocloeon triangulifer TaxID=2078957 RepID=UPI00286F5942|nr:sialomucin core protein 24-like [Neocloeon triangulifer]